MSIMIGSARHDENGKYTGGAAGDSLQQNTPDLVGEVSMQTMYTHTKGWYILRPKTADLAAKLASAMTGACNNAAIGYDQGGRTGVITQVKATGALAKITAKTECDCSSLVRACCIEAGFDPGDFTTANEADKLAATGQFEAKQAYVSQTTTPVYNGDVLVTKTKGHTVIVVSGSARSAAASACTRTQFIRDVQTAIGVTVDGIAGPITLGATPTLSATKNPRHAAVKPVQQYLYALGFVQVGAADGIAGPKFTAAVKAYQTANGCTADGEITAKCKTWQKLLGLA